MKAKKTMIQRIYDALAKAGDKGLTNVRLRTLAPKFTYIISRLRDEGAEIAVARSPKSPRVFNYTLLNAQTA